MKRLLLIALLALSACRDETAALPQPVAMTETAVGHYCQMNVLEHPGPKAQVHLQGVDQPLFFSQVRDGLAYVRMPEQDYPILVLYVSDMDKAPSWENPGDDNWLRADDAFYVMGSAMTGGMGAAELVPFGTEAGAKAFAVRHGGKVLRIGDIPADAVLSPAETSPADDGNTGQPGYAERLKSLTRGQDT